MIYTLNGEYISKTANEALISKIGHAGCIVDGETIFLKQGRVTLDIALGYDLTGEPLDSVIFECREYTTEDVFNITALDGFNCSELQDVAVHWFTSREGYNAFIAKRMTEDSVFASHF